MRIVAALDGDLLVSQEPERGIPGQRDAIAREVEDLGVLLGGQHELVIVHGNAPQIGFVLLRSEVASHIVHPLPLDVCGSDTQGATGYLLQQAVRNWLGEHALHKEVVTLITQVLVDVADTNFSQPVRGVGPYFDPDKAQQYASTRSWKFVLVPGRGYRRAVPCLQPMQVIEMDLIRGLLASGAWVVCAGGGGIPVARDEHGQLRGVEAVIDKASTAQLLAEEVGADGIIFITVQPALEGLLKRGMDHTPTHLSLAELDGYVEQNQVVEENLRSKLEAGRRFLRSRAGWVLFSAPGFLSKELKASGGLLVTRERIVTVV
jgi:carbamate kinase